MLRPRARRASRVCLGLLAVLNALAGCEGTLSSRVRGFTDRGDAGTEWLGPEPDPGTDPTPDPGTDPTPDPGTDPTPDPGTDPTPDPGTDPAPDPGTDPAPDPGTEPAPDPGTDPAPDPGMDPAPDPGTDPAPDPGSGPVPGGCTYPAGASATINTGTIMPPYRWATAYTETGASMPFDLEDFHCGVGEWSRYHSVLFIVGTGWCPNCPTALRETAALDLPSRGTLVVYVESQDESYRSCNSASARRTVDRVIGSAAGLRIGDGENSMRDALGDQTSTVPSGYMVRSSDMRVLADENQLGFTPNWAEIAANPDMDWPSRFGHPAPPPPAACMEETYEPNDTRAAAAPIAPGGFNAGICGANDDYYAVSLTGRWRVDLDFRHSDGDIDLFALDASGRVIGTSDSADDDESLTSTGAATLRVIGYGGARAPYRLVLTEL
jgi:hypothetical protein